MTEVKKIKYLIFFSCFTKLVHVQSIQACFTLCDPMDYNPPGSSVHGILQATKDRGELPCPPPGDLPNLGIKPGSHALQADSLPTELPRSPSFSRSNALKL